MIIEEGIYAKVMSGWANPNYTLLEEWVAGCEGAVWDYNGGRSWINGKVYPSYLFFDTEEDLLICKLKFPDIIRIPQL